MKGPPKRPCSTEGTTAGIRVCGSLLRAIDCPELITYAPDLFESMALSLARSPEALAAIRDRLRRNRHQPTEYQA